MSETQQKTCFVISPIGSAGSEKHEKFKEVLEYLIKPAVADSGYKLEVTRADDIERPGSFIKDILDNLLNSYVVIADLTDQNPNVFYELGVRHSLSSRTILIAQDLEFIPSDLREYRTIVYEVSLKGAAQFKDRIKKYIVDMFKDPDRPDNPVLDRLPSVMERQIVAVERENNELKREITTLLKKGPDSPSKTPKSRPVSQDSARTRVERIITIDKLKTELFAFSWSMRNTGKTFTIPGERGDFKIYRSKDFFINGDVNIAYIAVPHVINWDSILADIRVLMSECEGPQTPIRFVVATSEDYSKDNATIVKRFKAMLAFVPVASRKRYSLEIWDADGLKRVEAKLGLRVGIDRATAEVAPSKEAVSGAKT